MWAAAKGWTSPKARSAAAVLVLLLAGVGLQGSSSRAASCSGFGITDISPAVGFVTGGTSTTITGCGFSGSGTLTVKFGSASPITVSPASDTSLTVTTPSGSPGDATVEVRLHPSSGTDSTATTTFTYLAKPAITSIASHSGPEQGGTKVHVKGSALTETGATTSVDFGSTAAASLSDVTGTSLFAFSPAGTGTQNVTVTVTLPGGESATSNGLPFKFVPAPTVTSVAPTSGPVTGGTLVTVTGTGFQAGAQVLFGPSDGSSDLTQDSSGAPVAVLSATSILVTAPAGIVGATNVVVLNPDGQSGALKSSSAHPFTYTGTAPSITSVSPTSGSSLGGDSVTVNGAGFLPGAHVDFGTAAGTAVTVSGDGTSLTVTTPAHAAGPVTVKVTNQGGGSASKSDAFTFDAVDAPTLTAVSGNTSGTSLGGTSVKLTGTHFVTGTQVSFGGTPAASAAAIDDKTINATTPAHAAGAVSVTVTLPDGQSATLATAFTFVAADAPTISTVNPTTGTSGTEITITGTGFATTVNPANAVSPAIVSVGSAACVPGQSADSDSSCLQPSPDPSCQHCFQPIVRTPTSIVGLVPNEPGGATSVTVTNPDGQTVSQTFTITGFSGAPTLTSISPATANTLGHTSVELTGTKFAPGARVIFAPPGSKGAQGTVTNISADGKTIDAIAPAGVYGRVDVTVVDPDPDNNPSQLTATLEDGFEFTAADRPTITSITPSSGPGGTQVTITGTGFANTNDPATNASLPATVTIGGQQLLPLVQTTLSASAAAGDTNIKVTSISGMTAGNTLTIDPSGANPEKVTISIVGTAGAGGTGVTFAPALAFAHGLGSVVGAPIVLDSTTITGIVPTAPASTVDVAVMNPDGQGAILAGGYTYPPDTTPPTTTAAPTVNGAPYTFGDWATGPVAIQLTATDDTSGVKDITFSSSGAQTSAGTTVPGDHRSASITAQGKTTITYFASDNAGNVESANTRQVWIDSGAPTLTAAATTDSGANTYLPGTTTSKDVTVAFSCSDGNSGVSTLTYTSAATTTSSGTNPLSVTVTSPGIDQSVKGTCTDAAGNKTSVTFDNIDIVHTAPTIAVTATTAGGTPYTAGTWVHRTVTVTFTCTPISADNQIVSITGPVQVDGPATNQTVTGHCTDAAGNVATATFGTATLGIDIDHTLPIATATATTTDNNGATVPYVAGTWTNHNVVVTFHCTDSGPNQSGVASVDSPVTISAEGTTHGVDGSCTDTAGNHANPPAFFGPILIDKTPPSCTVAVIPTSLGSNSGKLVNVTATVFITDDRSGENGSVLRSVTSNNPATAASDIVGFTIGTADFAGQLRATKGRVYTFTYQAFDRAGNASHLCSVSVAVG
jgi:hypothetical protein